MVCEVNNLETEKNINEYTNELEQQVDKLSVELNCERIRYRIASEFIDAGIWEYDIASKTFFQYKKLSGKFSENTEPIPNFRETMTGWGIIYADDIPLFCKFCDSLDRGDPKMTADVRSYDDEYNSRWQRYEGITVYDSAGKPYKVIGRTLDVTKEHNGGSDFDKGIKKDDITGLPKKYDGERLCREQLKKKPLGKKAALIIFDLDDFRNINDKWGHLYGDFVLETFANIMTGCMSPRDVAYRLGGDKFTVLKFCESVLDIENFYTSVSDRFNSFNFPKGGSFGISAGAAEYSEELAFEELLKKAVISLCVSKSKENKSRMMIYSGEMENDDIIEKAADKITEEETDSHSVKFMNGSEKRIYDFAFDMFNKCSEPDEAINYIFPELGKYYGIDNILVYEKNSNNDVFLTHSWINNDARNRRGDRRKQFLKKWSVLENFYSTNPFFAAYEKGDLALRCPIFDGSDLVGFISYEIYGTDKNWDDSEINALCSLSKMLSVYLLKFRSKSTLEDVNFYTRAMLDSQQLVSYSIDPKTYTIKYISPYAVNRFPNIRIGEKCYKCVMSEDKPCKSCPICTADNSWKRTESEVYNSKYNCWLRYTVTKIRPTEDAEDYLVCLNDITSFIQRVSSKDSLTQLPTYEAFTAEASKVLYNDISYAAAVVSIAKFRAINENNGIGVGNTVLTELAHKIEYSLGSNEYACRWGGGKFIMLVDSGAGAEAVQQRIETLINTCSADVFALTGINVFFNCGLYCIDKNSVQLISGIDKANSARKSAASSYAGVNRVEVYDKAAEEKFNDIKEIESIMQEALENDEFKAFYQPKVRLSDGRITGAEALVRWIRPNGEMVSPGKFVPAFEENGFITEMDFAIYRQVFSDIRRWIDMGKRVPVVSINVSRRHFIGDEFPRKIEELREKYNVPHRYIELEITESMFSNNLNHVINTVDILRDYGFSISVDDFGAGYSNLNLITKLPVDVLKVDGGFFINRQLNEKDKAVISTIISLAHSLNLYVVSEGIENKHQVDFLNASGCDSVQGFFFYKPMCSADFEKLIE